MGKRILVVDDEPAVVELLEYNLRKAKYDVRTAPDAQVALRQIEKAAPDLILLDLMLPGMDGFELCRELRRLGSFPIIMLTARGEEVDKVVGLELGADDYIVKPFGIRELLARIRAVLRRTSAEPRCAAELSGPHGLRLQPETREAWLTSRPLSLTQLEFDLLALLLSHSGRVFTREQLLRQAWGYSFEGDVRAVDSAVKRLRMKIRELSPGIDFVETIRGVGYRITQGHPKP